MSPGLIPLPLLLCDNGDKIPHCLFVKTEIRFQAKLRQTSLILSCINCFTCETPTWASSLGVRHSYKVFTPAELSNEVTLESDLSMCLAIQSSDSFNLSWEVKITIANEGVVMWLGGRGLACCIIGPVSHPAVQCNNSIMWLNCSPPIINRYLNWSN